MADNKYGFSPYFITFKNFIRRQSWLFRHLTFLRFINVCKCFFNYVLRRRVFKTLPVVLKIDISPVCNLSCNFCVHGEGYGNKEQDFKGGKMSLQEFQDILDQVSEHTSALSLYYLGDSLAHPQIAELCAAAAEKNLYTHISTHFSYKIPEKKIDQLLLSGVSRIKIGLDALDQESYSQIRTGGSIDLVKRNFELLCNRRAALKTKNTIEIQTVVYDFNSHQVDDV